MNYLAIADLADGRGWRLAAARSRMSLDLSISDLADGNGNGSCVYLWLTICDGRHNGSLDRLGADSGLFMAVISTPSVSVARQYAKLDWFALRRPVTVVQIIKVPGATLVEGG